MENSKKGFSIIEIIVIITIISFGFLGALVTVRSSMASATKIQNRLLATALAQEGVEIVRNLRDRNWTLARAWNTGFQAGNFRVQWNSAELLPFSDTALRFDNQTGVYSYETGEESPFKRTISINFPQANEMKIIVSVNWTDRGRSFSASAEEHLFNWKSQ